MKYCSDPIYNKQYKRGYAFGMNPVFHDCEDPVRIVPAAHDAAFLRGFETGRNNYVLYNGPICDGIPDQILNDHAIAAFKVDGQLGYPLLLSGYTIHQQQMIMQAYNDGCIDFDPRRVGVLRRVLETYGVFLQ